MEKLSKMVKIEKLEKISMGLANIQMTKMAKTCHFWRVFAKFVIFVVVLDIRGKDRSDNVVFFLLIAVYSLFITKNAILFYPIYF